MKNTYLLFAIYISVYLCSCSTNIVDRNCEISMGTLVPFSNHTTTIEINDSRMIKISKSFDYRNGHLAYYAFKETSEGLIGVDFETKSIWQNFRNRYVNFNVVYNRYKNNTLKTQANELTFDAKKYKIFYQTKDTICGINQTNILIVDFKMNNQNTKRTAKSMVAIPIK